MASTPHPPLSMRRLTPLAGALLLTGCALPPLTVVDRDASQALARAAWRPGGAAGGGGVELELAQVKARQVQQLTPGDTVRVADTSLDHPLLLNEAQARSAQLVYHHRLFAGRTVEMAWFAGAASGDLRWTSTEQGGGQRQARSHQSWTGPTGGVSGRWNLTPSLFGEARFAGTYIPGEAGLRSQTELALGWQFTPALQLRAGVASSALELTPGGGNTELVLRARGPFVTLVLGH